MPTHNPSPVFNPPASGPSTPPLPAKNNIKYTNEAPPHRPPTPTPSNPPTCDPPRHILSRLIAAVGHHAGVSIAALSAAISLAAVLEDPACLLPVSELGNGLVGLVCAGCVVMCVFMLRGVAGRFGVRGEGVWGVVWRLGVDCVRRGGDEGEDEDEDEMERSGMLVIEGGLDESTHASGLLGPSPLPRRYVGVDWEHFTGEGFRKREQKMRAVGRWSNMGRRGRTFGEVLREVEEVDERDRDERSGLS